MENEIEVRNKREVFLNSRRVFTLPNDDDGDKQFVSIIGTKERDQKVETLYVADGNTCCTQGNVYILGRESGDKYSLIRKTQRTGYPIYGLAPIIEREQLLVAGGGCKAGVQLVSESDALEVVSQPEYDALRTPSHPDGGYGRPEFFVSPESGVVIGLREEMRSIGYRVDGMPAILQSKNDRISDGPFSRFIDLTERLQNLGIENKLLLRNIEDFNIYRTR